MDAVALYRAGQLKPAIMALGEELKKQPLDAKRRTMLFELLCFAGEYDRAEKQLDMLADSSKEAIAGILVYKAALHAERTRQEMFASGTFPSDTPRPSGQGAVNGTPVVSFTDVDPRIGDHLEVFIAGSYTWIPLEYVASLAIEAPSKLRDLIWAPARLEVTPAFRLQELGEVLLPVLSPLSWKHDEDAVRLGSTTVWEDDERFGSLPFGQKLFAAENQEDDQEMALLEVRSLTFEHPVEAA
jgi:type VI secretion system protein ImpE